VVTAGGELVHADEQHNAELLWAARGAGPGFFGVVTAFTLRVYPRKAFELASNYVYPTGMVADVVAYLHEIATQTPAEIGALVRRMEATGGEPAISVTAIAYTDTEQEALDQLAVLERFPGRAGALQAHVNQVMDFQGSGTDGGAGDEVKRWVADNMATHADFADLRAGFDRMLADFPPAPSHLLVFNWGGYEANLERPSMAFSVDDDLFYGLYAAWDDAADDERYTRWVTETMRAWEPHASGTMLADENLTNRPFDFMAPENLRTLDELRSRWDPAGRFVSWLGRPELRTGH
jgi:FAD/FMN-containing dehydrogenase